jgi:hypothetical protein
MFQRMLGSRTDRNEQLGEEGGRKTSRETSSLTAFASSLNGGCYDRPDLGQSEVHDTGSPMTVRQNLEKSTRMKMRRGEG